MRRCSARQIVGSEQLPDRPSPFIEEELLSSPLCRVYEIHEPDAVASVATSPETPTKVSHVAAVLVGTLSEPPYNKVNCLTSRQARSVPSNRGWDTRGGRHRHIVYRTPGWRWSWWD